jgi:hypothetical protein
MCRKRHDAPQNRHAPHSFDAEVRTPGQTTRPTGQTASYSWAPTSRAARSPQRFRAGWHLGNLTWEAASEAVALNG